MEINGINVYPMDMHDAYGLEYINEFMDNEATKELLMGGVASTGDEELALMFYVRDIVEGASTVRLEGFNKETDCNIVINENDGKFILDFGIRRNGRSIIYNLSFSNIESALKMGGMLNDLYLDIFAKRLISDSKKLSEVSKYTMENLDMII